MSATMAGKRSRPTSVSRYSWRSGSREYGTRSSARPTDSASKRWERSSAPGMVQRLYSVQKLNQKSGNVIEPPVVDDRTPRSSMNETQLQSAPHRANETEIQALAREASELARELAEDIERERRLPDELVTRLRDGGLLRGGAPAEVAGLELAPPVALRCAEEIASGDA